MAYPPELDQWIADLAPALGLSDLDTDITAVLDLASLAAHTVARPAAPLTTYLVGVAVGRGIPWGEAVATVTRLVPEES